MLKITVNNEELDLGNLQGLTLKFNPGLFDNDSTDGSYTVPFTLPLSDINNKIFDFPYKLGSKNREIRQVNAELWHSGIRLKEGIIKATKFEKNIGCNFYIDNGNLYRDFREKQLPENDFGGWKSWQYKTEYNYALDDFLLYRVVNPNFLLDTLAYDAYNSYAINQNLYNQYTGFQISSIVPNAITPFPLLWRVLSKLFINKGFQYYDTYFATGDYRTINIFNVNNAIEADAYQSGGNTYIRDKLTRYNLANHLPDINTGEFIKAIQNFFNIKFYVKDYKVQVIDRLELINNNSFQDLSSRTIGDYLKTLTGENFEGIAFHMKRDDADENVNDLTDVTENEVITEIDIDPWLIENTEPYQTVLMANSSYAYYQKYINQRDIFPEDSSDYWYWYNFPYIYGQSHMHKNYCRQQGYYNYPYEFEINAELSGLPYVLFENNSGPNEYPYYFPRVKQKGNSYQRPVKEPYGLRLMMYAGMQNIEGVGYNQPCGAIGRNGIEITANWSYRNRWKDYISWFNEANKEEFEQDIKLNASELKNFNFAQKKLINNNLFFIKEMTVQLTRREVLPAACIMIKAL